MSSAPRQQHKHTAPSSSAEPAPAITAFPRRVSSTASAAAAAVTTHHHPSSEPGPRQQAIAVAVTRPHLGSSLTSGNASAIALAAARRGQRVEWARTAGDPSLDLVATSDTSIDPENRRRPERQDVDREDRIQRFLSDTGDGTVSSRSVRGSDKPARGYHDRATRALSAVAEIEKLFPTH